LDFKGEAKIGPRSSEDAQGEKKKKGREEEGQRKGKYIQG
jgi:hypothetical protein